MFQLPVAEEEDSDSRHGRGGRGVGTSRTRHTYSKHRTQCSGPTAALRVSLTRVAIAGNHDGHDDLIFDKATHLHVQEGIH